MVMLSANEATVKQRQRYADYYGELPRRGDRPNAVDVACPDCGESVEVRVEWHGWDYDLHVPERCDCKSDMDLHLVKREAGKAVGRQS